MTPNELLVTFPPVTPMEQDPSCYASGPVNNAGVYKKSFCVFVEVADYNAGQLYCNSIKMRPFQFDTAEDKQAVIEFADINRMGDYANQTFLYVYGKSDLGCTNINNVDGSFKESVGSCTMIAATICEYLDEDSEFYSCVLN